MTPEERGHSKILVYQYLPSRYGMNPKDLRRADAIEVVVGQGAKPGGGGMLLGQKISDRVAEVLLRRQRLDSRSLRFGKQATIKQYHLMLTNSDAHSSLPVMSLRLAIRCLRSRRPRVKWFQLCAMSPQVLASKIEDFICSFDPMVMSRASSHYAAGRKL